MAENPSRPSRLRFPTLLLGAAVLFGAVSAAPQAFAQPAQTGQLTAGMPLTDALLVLQERGMKLVFSTRVVRPEMRLVAAPVSSDPRALVEEILAPHGLAVEEAPGGSLVVVPARGPRPPATISGVVRSRHALSPLPGVSIRVVGTRLETVSGADGRYEIEGIEPGTYTLEARRSGFVIAEREGVAVFPAAQLDVPFVLQPAPLTGEEVVVNPSRIAVLQEEPNAPFALDQEQMLRLPHLGGDVFRTLSLLPGTTSNDVTAQFHIRGGRRDEVLVLLDGQELYEAYHLKDFDNALSRRRRVRALEPRPHDGRVPVELRRPDGGDPRPDDAHAVPPAPVSGVGERRERAARGGRDASVSAGRGSRRSVAVSPTSPGAIFGSEDPRFWDLFGKVDYRLTGSQSLRLNLLYSEDEFTFTETRAGRVQGVRHRVRQRVPLAHPPGGPHGTSLRRHRPLRDAGGPRPPGDRVGGREGGRSRGRRAG